MVQFLNLLVLLLVMQNSAREYSVTSASELLKKNFGYSPEQLFILVDIEKQELHVVKNNSVEKTYRISSATAGVGSKAGSNKTPPGVHRVAQKIGAGAPAGMIFEGRKPTGKIAPIISEPRDVPEDPVTTRIMWLEGLEPGINKGKGVDSHSRYIYIHGTHEEGLIGTPASHGCIRLANDDVISVFKKVQEGTLVLIAERLHH